MISPKQFEFFFALLEATSEHVYKLGLKDGAAPPCADKKKFTLTRANKLSIQTQFKKQFPNG